jgi:hypothetical protein
MVDQALHERLRQIVVEAVGGKSATPLLRAGDWWVASLPHHNSKADLVKIGGPFFLEKEDVAQDVLNILIGVLAARRPFCTAAEFELRVETPELVWWVAKERGHEEEIQGGPDPLDQALIRMSRLDSDEELFDNMLAVVSSLETALPDWRVKLLRSCCVTLSQQRCMTLAQQRVDLLVEIGLFFAPGHTVSLCTKGLWPNGDSKLGACAATCWGHILQFVLEATKRIDELLDFQFPPNAEAVVMQWEKMRVSVSPHGHPAWKFLPQI